MAVLPHFQLVDQYITDFDDVVIARAAVNRHGCSLHGGDLRLHILLALRDFHGLTAEVVQGPLDGPFSHDGCVGLGIGNAGRALDDLGAIAQGPITVGKGADLFGDSEEIHRLAGSANSHDSAKHISVFREVKRLSGQVVAQGVDQLGTNHHRAQQAVLGLNAIGVTHGNYPRRP
ncbi:hypothetical protein D3C76_1055160 [compost metagenome]